MAIKQALIVDDSKTARVILKRMLEELDLVADTTESAPEAIDYLKEHQPDVIFMDHMMPEMDGFEAVKHIKKNSQTAVIPIMMYTSRGGDLYLSQARALGAVGIIPKTISPIGLKEALFKLGLIEDRRKTKKLDEIIIDNKTAHPTERVDKTKQQLLEEDLREEHRKHNTHLDDLQRILDDQTIELHKSMWLGVESVGHEIFNRLNGELEEKFKNIEKMQDDVASLQRSNQKNKYLTPIIIVSSLLLLSLIFNVTLLTDNKRFVNRQAVNEQAAAEVTGEKKQLSASETLDQTVVVTPAKVKLNSVRQGNKNTIAEFIQWADNKKIEYPYNALALNDNRIKSIDALVKRALDAGYTGKIILQTHIGKFCMNRDLMGNYTLAEDNLPVTQCQYIGNYLQPTDTPTTHQSLSFANYLSDSGPLIIKGIALEVENESRSVELKPYPERLPKTTAKEWNLAAQSNNRVTVILQPASIDSIIESNQTFFE